MYWLKSFPDGSVTCSLLEDLELQALEWEQDLLFPESFSLPYLKWKPFYAPFVLQAKQVKEFILAGLESTSKLLTLTFPNSLLPIPSV